MNYEDMTYPQLKEEMMMQRYVVRVYAYGVKLAKNKIKQNEYVLNQDPKNIELRIFWINEWKRRLKWAEGMHREAEANLEYLKELKILCSDPKQKKRKKKLAYKRKHTGRYDPRKQTTPWNKPKYKSVAEFRAKELDKEE